MSEKRPVAKDDAGRTEDKSPLEAAKSVVAAHPIGSAAGAVGGIAAGAVAGIAAGPVGSLVGAAAGAVLGAAGAASSSATGPSVPADTHDATTHDAYWQAHFRSRPYAGPGASYDDYGPAYRYAAEAYARTDHVREWDEVEPQLALGWDAARQGSRLTWNDAQHAARDVWQRLMYPDEDEAAIVPR